MRYVLIFLIFAVGVFLIVNITANLINKSQTTDTSERADEVIIKPQIFNNPLSIESIKQKKIDGSNIVIEKEVPKGRIFHLLIRLTLLLPQSPLKSCHT